MRRAAPALCLALALLALAAPAGARAAFGFAPGGEGFEVAAENADGSPSALAGSHPWALRARFALQAAGGQGEGRLRDLRLRLPPGLLVNPTALGECQAAAFATPRVSPYEESASGESCPPGSQVGVARVRLAGGGERSFGLFSLVAPFGVAAALGFAPFGVPVEIDARLREGDAGVDLAIEGLSQALDLRGLELTIWGTPWLAAHDPLRGNCLDEQSGGSWAGCTVFGSAPAPESLIHSFLTLPTTPCGVPQAFTAAADSWEGAEAAAQATTPALGECHTSLSRVKVQLTGRRAAAPTGLVFNLGVNDGGGILNPAGVARPAIKESVVTLPAGLTINPSLAAGLGTCTEAQLAAETATGEFGAGCPPASKIGTVTVEGALGLEEVMSGSLFLAAPHQNPFGALIGLYLVAKLPRRGMIVTSEGELVPDPATGRLVATFDDLPRLLYTHFTLTLREGQRPPLLSPPLCGSYTAGLENASWAEPTVFGADQSTFAIDAGQGGGPCPTGGAPPFAPGLIAGSLNPQAGAYTPFYLRMTRGDTEQEITSYSATFPPGLLARLAGVATCPDAAIEAARETSGAAETQSPSCPAASQIGRTLAGYGVGGTLAWAPGNLYLAGPWHGAPLSTVAIDAATIGPFDLGTVVVRQAIRIDPRTVQASLDSQGSDPIPHILAGIPLHLRDIRVYVDRPGFTVNPTNCDPTSVSSTLGGSGADPFSAADDTTAGATERYQLIDCGALGFRPSLAFRLGASRHGAYPSLRATYRARPGEANLGALVVRLPPSLFLAQEHIEGVCTRARFAAGSCPADSIYGSATATTPLLEGPLTGPVYLRSSSGPVPDLVADLHGEGIEIEVPGRIDALGGAIRATFEGLPDAPVTSFTMTLRGGRHGLLQDAAGLCARKAPRATARFLAQDDSTHVTHPRLAAPCPGAHRKAPHKRRHRHRRHHKPTRKAPR